MSKKQPTLPYVNPEAERAVLGALLIAGDDHELSDPLLALLTEGDFYEPRHAHVYHSIRDLHTCGKAPDVVLVDEWLRYSGDLGAVTQTYIHELANTCV